MEPLLDSSAPWKGEIGGNNGSKMEAPLSLDVEKKEMSSFMSRRRERGANSESKTEPLLQPEVENSSAPCKGEIERNNGSKMELPLSPVVKKKDMVGADNESKTEPSRSTAVEKDMSWRINLGEFPKFTERREFWPGTSHISFRF